MPDYDVIVLGGGSAGTAAAAAATHAGARTLLVNDGELGGLCILRGCMPTKAMLASAHAAREADRLDRFGLRLEGRVVPDFERIMARKQAQVRRFQRAKIASVERQAYAVRFGRARFVAGGAVEIDGERLTARGFVVATGSLPSSIPIPGLERVPVWTSDDVMRLERQPGSLLIQGAGPIALELAQFFSRIGTRVLLVNRSSLLSRVDAECGEALRRALADEPLLEVAAPGRIVRLEPDGDGLLAHVVRDGERSTFGADALLMATGRRAAIDDLGLEHLGLDASAGRLEHDDTMGTAHEGVYVAGDATGRHQILHLATQEGAVAGHNAAGRRPERRMDYRLAMSVVFSDPPFAHVGMTEAEARARGRDVVVGRARFAETGRAITMETDHGLWKLLADRGTGELLGSTCLGPRADDLIHLISTMMHYGGSCEDIARLPWYHPTLSEVMLNLGRDLAEQRSPEAREACPATLPPGQRS